jgi:hypothetical protein
MQVELFEISFQGLLIFCFFCSPQFLEVCELYLVHSFCLVLVVLGFELSALHLLVTCCTVRATPPASSTIFECACLRFSIPTYSVLGSQGHTMFLHALSYLGHMSCFSGFFGGST